MELIVGSQMMPIGEEAWPPSIRGQSDVAVSACAEYSGKDSIGLCLDPFDLRGH